MTTINEQERAAYIAGDTRTADLLARIAELEAERDALAEDMEQIRDQIPDPAQAAQDESDLMHLKAFFYDCFLRLPNDYPCPEFSSEYDKNVIFEAIEKGGAA